MKGVACHPEVRQRRRTPPLRARSPCQFVRYSTLSSVTRRRSITATPFFSFGFTLSVCRPLGVEIYRVEPALLEGWQPPQRAAYDGLHGLRLQKPDWER